MKLNSYKSISVMSVHPHMPRSHTYTHVLMVMDISMYICVCMHTNVCLRVQSVHLYAFV